MNIARFFWDGRIRWGIVEGDDLHAIRGNLFRDLKPGNRVCAVSEARLLAPIEPTNKVVGIAVNYGDRAGRNGPGIFMKQSGTIIGHLDPIVYPRVCTRVIHEAELGIVIGHTARNVSPSGALDYVFGYTCANDVSAAEMKTNDVGAGSSMRVKQFDTFCPLGPFIVTGLNGDNLRVQCRVNGKTEADSSTSQMIWNVAELVSWVSTVMALNPGDIISAGCPEIGDINIGDTVEVEVEGIGILRNPVVADG
ncbi:MAG: fumarylacetoacetate hydrolase family protein [Chloroflexi bacterium]|nr:fumarylacetoacetate hydrolase family protein [Chloroflexota bacterium]